jgi:hypothetical protein
LLQGGTGTQLLLTLQGLHSTDCNTRRAAGRARPTASVGLASWPATVGFAVTAVGGGSALSLSPLPPSCLRHLSNLFNDFI